MQVSVIIPVWNGESIIGECLRALTADAPEQLFEVICVDNASADDSARRIVDSFPDVTLLRQPVNLGFAGGVNVGLRAATGDLLVLLNQDCLVRPGWIEALINAVQRHPQCGIAGCTIFNADGTINHTGAQLERPSAYGVHLTELTEDAVERDYVTGALFAIRRAAWEAIGEFDEDFYPAYYEESDYCYRARVHGFEVRYVPDAQAEHLFTARDWRADPIKHAANQHQSRFRFICKHFDSERVATFFQAERAAIEAEVYRDQRIGRVEAIRHTLQHLTAILDRRALDLGQPLDPALARHLRVGFGELWRVANERAVQGDVSDGMPASAAALLAARRERMFQLLDELRGARAEAERLRGLQRQVLDQIYFRSPIAMDERGSGPESTIARLFRLLIKRPASILSGREYLLRSKLNVLQAMQLEQTEHVDRCTNELLDLTLSQVERITGEQAMMRLLADYEYR